MLEHEPRAVEIVACGGWSRRDKLYTGGDAAGTTGCSIPATEPARVRAMFVREDWTRRGLGGGSSRPARRRPRSEGSRTLVLERDAAGLPLYHAYGFAPVEGETSVILPADVQSSIESSSP